MNKAYYLVLTVLSSFFSAITFVAIFLSDSILTAGIIIAQLFLFINLALISWKKFKEDEAKY